MSPHCNQIFQEHFRAAGPRWPFVVLFLILGISTATSSAVTYIVANQDLTRESLPDHWKTDAELTDLFFLDKNKGWAVGAQGVILRTVDGGENWEEISQAKNAIARQMSLDEKFRNLRAGTQTRSTGMTNGQPSDRPVRCRFESVHFSDALHGWVAGGYKVPYLNRTRAVILKTDDGGITWKQISGLVIPRVHRIHFSDPMHGWAVGESSNLFPSGIFHSNNGGLSWSSKASDRSDGWIDADPTTTGFITADQQGRPGSVAHNRYQASVVLETENTSGDHFSIAQLRMSDPKSGWAVGDHGTLVHTTNRGLSWSPPKSLVAGSDIANLLRRFDFTTLAITERTIWFAGDPGTFLFAFNRATGSIKATRTPLATRINRLHFLDDQNGWAVGPLGTIIATRDGGNNWHVQRGEHRRVAMLSVAPQFNDLPLAALAKYASEENRLCASIVLHGSRTQHKIAIQSAERLGSLTSILISDQTNSAHVDPEFVLEKTVRVIRTLRPNLLVYHEQTPSPPIGTANSTSPITLIQNAVLKAADPNAYPFQISELGLRVWQVDRLAIRGPAGKVALNPQRLLPRSGALIEDLVAISRATLGLSTVMDVSPRYRVKNFTSFDRMKASNLLSGLSQRKGVPTRKLQNPMHSNLTMIQELSAKQERFKQFESFEAKTPSDFRIWNQQVLSFALKLDQQVAGIWLMQLAERYLDSGKIELAANANHLLITRWPDHALTPAATTWLAAYFASDEFGQLEFQTRTRNESMAGTTHRAQSIQTQSSFTLAPKPIQRNGVSGLVWLPVDPDASDIEQTTATESIEEKRTQFFDQRIRQAGRYLSELGQRDPDLAASPQYRLKQAQITRRLTGSMINNGQFDNLANRLESTDLGISIAAQRELQLVKNSTAVGDTVRVCQFTDSRPTLDGILNERFWQSAKRLDQSRTKRISENQAAGDRTHPSPDIALVAFDDQFLYAGFTCQKIPGHFYKSRNQARPRDANLDHRDRIELILDLDRDYQTSFRFIVDHRGWVREDCAGCLGWNPDWYVSQSETDHSWTVEFAIPLSQLTDIEIDQKSVWSVRMARVSFDNENMWGPAERPRHSRQQGIQAAFESKPQQFDLIRFEGMPSGSTLVNPDSPASIPANSEYLQRNSTHLPSNSENINRQEL